MTPRTIPRVAAAFAVGAALVAAAVLPAQAHNFLVASTPADGEVLTALPPAFSVTTNAPLLDLSGDGGGFAIQVTDAAGAFYGDGCLAVVDATLSMGAALGEPGPYRLVWQVVSEDGHPVSGELTFQWAPDAGFEPEVGRPAPPVCGEAPPQPTPTATPEPAPSASADGEPSRTPVAQPEQDTADLGTVLWIGGAVVAVLVAGAVLVLVLSRRNRAG